MVKDFQDLSYKGPPDLVNRCHSSLDNSDLFLTTSSFSSSSSENSGEKPARTEWWRLVGLEGGPTLDFLKRISNKKRRDETTDLVNEDKYCNLLPLS